MKRAQAFPAGGVLARLTAADLIGPDWLRSARRDAASWVATHGFPTGKHEDWRYTKLSPVLDVLYEPARPDSVSRVTEELVLAGAPDLGGPRLVFVNGHFRADLSLSPPMPAGATVTHLAAALAGERDRLEPVLTEDLAADGSQPAFAAVNQVLAADGAFVYLAAGVALPAPIHLIYIGDAAGEHLLINPRSVFLLDEGSEAQLVETHFGFDGGAYCTNALTSVQVAPHARLEHYKLQDEPLSAQHLARINVRQERDSTFSSHLSMLGGHIGRHEVRVELHGEGARLELAGLYLPTGDQVHDNTLFVDHVAPNCTSHQLYKGALAGRSRGIFNGHIMVRPGADGTDAHQTNKNLVLADRAEADTRPRLEIYADDVACTHGAAVGQLDEDAVLYLRSRGIQEQAARHLLVKAFVQEMVDRVSLRPLREQLQSLVEGRSFE